MVIQRFSMLRRLGHKLLSIRNLAVSIRRLPLTLMSSRAIQSLPGKLIEGGQVTFKISLSVFKHQKKGAYSSLSDSTLTL
jgi:hypothetical protein